MIKSADSRSPSQRFEEAAQYAPNWGRLHLEWGRALLTPDDKVLLAKWMRTHG